ncbi:hypothetical protein [Chondromyces apiculatus]|uniref:Uncharacterized protein n=1 Tax=Chondromyces apiculatus DSM 436 TaxID=1192034 RepID=A0A017SWA0_9BACT|nr:hypothetical protein [Chondromyces apiculatus]EYF00895.1 Hypothetical protein CAP_8912 [Chondromyces apiculatus DSM 436]
MSAAVLQQTRLGQLRKLGAVLAPLDQPATQAIHRRFMESFVDPLRHDELLWALSKRRPIDHHRFLRADVVWPSAPAGASIAWLTAGSPEAGCFRLEREPWLPGVRLQPASLDEVWVGSWPGVFVCFDAGRAVLVTLDYERIFCNLRGRSPYR